MLSIFNLSLNQDDKYAFKLNHNFYYFSIDFLMKI